MSDFLEYLDAQHKKIIVENKIKNKRYNMDLSLKPLDFKYNNKFMIKKSYKTRIIYIAEGIQVDFTDYDIVYTVCQLEQSITKSIVDSLLEIYNGKHNQFHFQIGTQKFVGVGLDYSKFDNFSFSTYADVEIELYSFLFILNMIIYKDFEGQKYYNRDDGVILLQRTLNKYILLINHFALNDEAAKKYLLSVDFPIENTLDKLVQFKMENKHYDIKFSGKIF